MKYILKKILYVCTFLVAFLCGYLDAGCTSDVPLPSEHKYISFELIQGFILIEAEVDGRKGSYIFDTGTPHLMLNRKVNHSEFELISLGRTFQAEEIMIEEFKLGPFIKGGMTAWGLDLSFVELIVDRPVEGLLGSEIIGENRITIDFENERILIDDPPQVDHSQYSIVSIDFDILEKNLPAIRMKVNDRDVVLGFDTGANVHVLDESFRKLMVQENQLDSQVPINFMFDMSIKKVKVRNSPFVFYDMEEYNFPPFRELDGVLSVSSLNADLVLVDMAKQRIHLFWGKNKVLESLDLAQKSN